MQVEPYLMFNGRCEEAVDFYGAVLGAEVEMLLRFRESPDEPPPGIMPADWDDKIMHCALRIGSTRVMASDGLRLGRRRLQGRLSHRLGRDRTGSGPCLRGALGGRTCDDATRENLLLAALRHADGPLRPRLDGESSRQRTPRWRHEEAVSARERHSDHSIWRGRDIRSSIPAPIFTLRTQPAWTTPVGRVKQVSPLIFPSHTREYHV